MAHEHSEEELEPAGAAWVRAARGQTRYGKGPRRRAAATSVSARSAMSTLALAAP
jgi:hypothetical protein